MSADMTARLEPDESPVFFEDAPALPVEEKPKKSTKKKEVVEETGEVLI